MSDFVTAAGAGLVAAATVVSLVACLVLLVIASAPQGAWPSDNTTGHVWDEDLRETEQPAAALVDVAVRHHRRLRGRLPGALPGAGQLRTARSKLDQRRPVRGRAGQGARRHGAGVCQVRRDDGRAAGQGPAGHGHRRAPVPQQLRAVPRLGRARQQGLPEPDRQRLAVRRHATTTSRPTITAGPQRRDAADGRRGGQRRGRAQRRQLRAEPVGQRARQRRGATGQGQVRRLRRLPRCRRQGQPGARRAQPDRQDLAARLGRAGHRRRWSTQRQEQRHAGAGPRC